MLKRIASLMVLAWASLAAADAAYACICVQTNTHMPMREAVAAEAGKAQLVFVGIAESKAGQIVTFRMVESFKGQDSTQLSVSDSTSTSCGYGFQLGRAYLVFAYGAGPTFHTFLCTLNTPIEQADGFIRYLRREPPKPEDLLDLQTHQMLRRSQTTGSVCGTLRRRGGGPVKSTRVYAIQHGLTGTFPDWFTQIKRNGSYCIDGLAPGDYLITAVLEEGQRRLSGGYRKDGAQSFSSVTVVAGKQTPNIDVLIGKEKLIKLHGQLRGHPPEAFDYRQASLHFSTYWDNPLPFHRLVRPDKSGSFTAFLPAGKIQISATLRHDGANWVAYKQVELKDEDQEILVVALRQSVRQPR